MNVNKKLMFDDTMMIMTKNKTNQHRGGVWVMWGVGEGGIHEHNKTLL